MQQYFKISQLAVTALAERYGSPLLVLSVDQIERNYRFLQENLPGVKIYYAVKANPDANIVNTLARLGSCFDVASDGEMITLAAMGIEPERMVYANPVKTAAGLVAAHRTGVAKFTFDSASEIPKMAKMVPGGTVLLRVRMDNPNAHVDLNAKFGARPEDVLDLLRSARDYGLDVAGLCFHVGSQNTSPTPYVNALQVCSKLFSEAKAAGFDLRILDIGGGFPIPTMNEEVDTEYILGTISQALTTYFPDTEIWAEPGRFICGTAVNLITRVIGKQERNNKQWYFLDEGLYGSFSGVILDHWDYELESFKTGMLIPATFAGPSCDSIDIMFRDKLTPILDIDDLLLTPMCGAYTSASATVFNGFAKAPIIVWEEVQDELHEAVFAHAG
jgi:ornithine decarboxylase